MRFCHFTIGVPILSFIASVSAHDASTKEDCLNKDIACQPRLPNETQSQYCARVLKAKEAGNPGYKLAHCDWPQFDFRWVEPQSRPKSISSDFRKSIKAEGIQNPPGYGRIVAEHEGSAPLAAMGKGIGDLTLLHYKNRWRSIRKFLPYSSDAESFFEDCGKKIVTFPSEAKAGEIAFQTLNDAITSIGMLGIRPGVHSREVISRLPENRGPALESHEISSAQPHRGSGETITGELGAIRALTRKQPQSMAESQQHILELSSELEAVCARLPNDVLLNEIQTILNRLTAKRGHLPGLDHNKSEISSVGDVARNHLFRSGQTVAKPNVKYPDTDVLKVMSSTIKTGADLFKEFVASGDIPPNDPDYQSLAQQVVDSRMIEEFKSRLDSGTLKVNP